jgi:hypothetical protein
MRMLTPELVHQIRTARLTDTEWSRRLDVSVRTIRDARVGNTWPSVATPPDIRIRIGNGRGQKSGANLTRERWGYFRE